MTAKQAGVLRRNVALGLALGSAVALACCAKPPQTAYENTAAAQGGTGLPVGQNGAGESCTLNRTDGTAAVYCGTWDQPSAQVSSGGATSPADLPALAATSAWRASLESTYDCGAPSAATILDGVPAELLSCTQRYGGWPHAALVAVIGGTAYYADGVTPALAPMERAIGVLSGRVPPGKAADLPLTEEDQALAQRLAAQAFSSGDVKQYDALMVLGAKANQAEDFPSAVIAYRAALALQQKKLGANDPGTMVPLLELALNLSNEGQYAPAATSFAAAAKLAPRSSDPTAAAKLFHYQGLDQLNQTHAPQALALLRQADAAYAALLPAEVLNAQPQAQSNDAQFGFSAPAGTGALLNAQVTLNSPAIQTALLGLIETRRYEAVALLASGDTTDAATEMGSAERLATANGVAPPVLTARLSRSGAELALARGENGTASADLSNAAADFSAAIPGSRPVAETALLRAVALSAQGDSGSALTACRSGVALLKTLQLGTSPELLGPCLDIYAATAQAKPDQANALHAEMFEAAELTQGSVTAQEIAAAAARLSSSSSDPKVAAAIRAQQDAQAHLVALYQQRDALTQAQGGGDAAALAALDKQIASANADLAATGQAEQAAAPNFGQLVQQEVPASEVLARLRPDEAFLGITSTPAHSWLFFLAGGKVQVAQSPLTTDNLTTLVQAVRTSIEPGQNGLPPFDMADAQTLYAGTLGPFATQMTSVHELVIAPSGPLLALPFALLPTGPASAADLANTPWLVREATLSYVPAAANFVSLRKVAGTSAATRPWFGFGDFIPATLPQAQATYNAPSCGDSAALFANLPTLPYAKLELQAGAAIFGATPDDELLGPGFTVPEVEKANLKAYRILHFATHGLLPTDLPCQTEPAIVASTVPGAPSADGALLTTSAVTDLHLDADLVLLSACNTGGGAAGGESLSGLARSFFYAGARALMVTQWSVNDQVSAYLVADTLSRLHAGTDGGAAGSLRAAQLGLIEGAGHSLPAEVANPFFWAAFAVIGDGGASRSGPPSSGL
jgi:CHAT domain-containing protein